MGPHCTQTQRRPTPQHRRLGCGFLSSKKPHATLASLCCASCCVFTSIICCACIMCKRGKIAKRPNNSSYDAKSLRSVKKSSPTPFFGRCTLWMLHAPLRSAKSALSCYCEMNSVEGQTRARSPTVQFRISALRIVCPSDVRLGRAFRPDNPDMASKLQVGCAGEGLKSRLTDGRAICDKVARWQNLIPSFPWIAPGRRAWGRNPRKERDQILQRSVAEP